MELPLVAYTLPDMLTVTKTHGKFADRYSNVSVFEVTGGRNNFSAFVYMCRLNLDLDGDDIPNALDSAPTVHAGGDNGNFALQAEPDEENALSSVDWGNPGKSHKTDDNPND